MTMMEEYPKIQSIFKRDDRSHKFIESMWSLPEFDYLKNNPWRWTEKIDGTNVRVLWEPPSTITFGGRTDRAQMPTFLLKHLQETFTIDSLSAVFPDTPVCLYGEGYGAKIQKGGGNYIADGVGFILFDVLIDGWWLEHNNMNGIAAALGILIVPTILFGTIPDAIKSVKAGLISTFGNFQAEGLVGKPLLELHSRNGNRIITKLKGRDF